MNTVRNVKHQMYVPVTLPANLLAKVHDRIGCKKFSRSHLLLDYLNEHPLSTTENIMEDCTIKNVSDKARRIASALLEYNVLIGCESSVHLMLKPSGTCGKPVWRWSLYKVGNTAV